MIKNLAPARNVDEACKILGLLGYYRSFVPAFANITLPITSLLKKNTPFVLYEKCQLALDYWKEIFCNKPILQFPDPNKPCILYTDASNNAYSGVLCQSISNDQDIRPVAYFWYFWEHSQHKTEVGVQPKKKLMLYWKACNNLTTILEEQNVPFVVITNH